MTADAAAADHQRLDAALRAARDTRLLVLERGARFETAKAFASLFASSPAVVVADPRTFAAAGRDVCDALTAAGRPCAEPILLDSPHLYAESSFVDEVQRALARSDAVAIAVGSGTINDVTKLASHRCGRPYLSVATAASMDGYTAYGASITHQGSKQTFDCPAPRGVVADLDVLVAAPPDMNAAGYADLIAKCPAGADWLLADALDVEPLDPVAWDTVQTRLRHWISDPAGVRNGDFDALHRLITGLMMTGFAMQSACTSRPASGAEHQFSHLWDMQHHTYLGQTPSHGFKVGIGSLASLDLYETLPQLDIQRLDVESAVAAWPDAASNQREIDELFLEPELAAKAAEESAVKLAGADELRRQLEQLVGRWPALQTRLNDLLIPRAEFADMLRSAGCPADSTAIGISPERLRLSYRQAYHIRRRFTVLDVARRTSLLLPALDRIFSASR